MFTDRLVARTSAGPWGEGLLVDLAHSCSSDADLKESVLDLLSQRWKDDARRCDMSTSTNANEELTRLKTKGTRGSRFKGVGNAIFGAAAFGGNKLLQRASERASDGGHDHVETWADVLLHARGNVGETALHLCCLLHTLQHQRLVRVLVPWLAKRRTLDRFGEEINALDATYLRQHFHGEVALHLAVSHLDLDMVKLLVEHGADVSPHASGDFLYSSSKVGAGAFGLSEAPGFDHSPASR